VTAVVVLAVLGDSLRVLLAPPSLVVGVLLPPQLLIVRAAQPTNGAGAVTALDFALWSVRLVGVARAHADSLLAEARNLLSAWLSADGELFRQTTQGSVVFTNPVNGQSLTNSFAGQLTDIIVSGDPEGVHTDLVTQRGLPEKLKLPHGAVLLRDAGIIAFTLTFDGDEFISQEIVVVKGPHPEADSDFELFCEIATEALGIS